MQQQTAAPARRRRLDWLTAAIILMVVFNGLPFLAPIFMEMGWTQAGRLIYLAYSPLCHQMAQRSFFLFGPAGFQMHELADLPVSTEGMSTAQALVTLRLFVGSETLGWKVAWSDRMVYMYTAPLLVAIVYAFLRRRGRVKPLPLWAFALLLLPMALDGGTHWLSDFTGIGAGFRYDNAWLAQLTGHALPPSFYAGDAFGSFNSIMRLVSGLTFGAAFGGLLFPYIDLAARPGPPAPVQREQAAGPSPASAGTPSRP